MVLTVVPVAAQLVVGQVIVPQPPGLVSVGVGKEFVGVELTSTREPQVNVTFPVVAKVLCIAAGNIEVQLSAITV